MSTVDELQKILDQVGDIFEYTSEDVEHWMDEEQIGDALRKRLLKGDCDDHALACRYLARQQDIDTRLVYCRTRSGIGHLVLEHKGWILDNNSPWVRRRDDIDYQWIAISGYESGDPWKSIRG